MNELSQGQRIKIPGSVVRSVSFQKIREGSLSSRNKPKQVQPKVSKYETGQLYNRLIGKKLGEDKINNQKVTAAQMKEEIQRKQMEQCTFKPRTNVVDLQPRTVNQFSQQQLAYKKNTEEKIKFMRDVIQEQKEKENTFQPNLHRKKQRKQGEQVYDRLYQDYRKRKETQEHKMEESQQKNRNSKNKFTTFSRNTSQQSLIQRKILSDAYDNSSVSKYGQTHQIKDLSRNTSNKSLKTKGLSITKNMNARELYEAKLNKVTTKNKDEKNKNDKNKEIYIRKILRQISLVLQELKLSSTEITYIQMGQILQKMNFIQDIDNMDERKHLSQIWQMLQGDMYEMIYLTNLIKVIFCFLACHDTKMIEYCVNSCQNGILKGEQARKLVISEKDSKNIKAKFQNLYLNRLNKGQFIVQTQSQQYSFKPFISKQSAEMAGKYRKKILQESEKLLNDNLIQYNVAQNGIIDHFDLLLLDDKRKQLKLKMMREEQEKEKKRQEDEVMMNNHTERHSSNSIGTSKCNELYELGKNALRSKRHEKTYEDNRFSQECTFQPNIQKSREGSAKIQSREISQIQREKSIQITSFHNQTQQIPDFDKSIFRMFEARKRRQNSQPSSHRGAKPKEEPSPLLYLNVNMEGFDDVKIPVFNTDNMKSITHKVRILLGIQATEQYKLEKIIKMQIIPALQQLGLS